MAEQFATKSEKNRSAGKAERSIEPFSRVASFDPYVNIINLQHSIGNRAVRQLLQPDMAGVPPIVNEVLRSPGQPLDAKKRAFFEQRFRHDFSQVRIHSDMKAAESAKAVKAQAYTVGRDIVFGDKGRTLYNSDEQQLLAHELAHVVQQRRYNGVISSPVTQDLALERDAEHAATLAHANGHIPVAYQSGICLARAKDSKKPEQYSDEALVFEYERIRNWLNLHPSAGPEHESSEHKAMQYYLEQLQEIALKRIGKDIFQKTFTELPLERKLSPLPSEHPTIGVDPHPNQPDYDYIYEKEMEARRQLIEDGEVVRSSPLAGACYGVRRSIWGENHGEAMGRARLMANVEDVLSASAAVAQGKQQIDAVGQALRPEPTEIGMVYNIKNGTESAPQEPVGSPRQMPLTPEQPFIPVAPIPQIPRIRPFVPQPQAESGRAKDVEATTEREELGSDPNLMQTKQTPALLLPKSKMAAPTVPNKQTALKARQKAYVNTVPELHPLLSSGLKNYSNKEILDFFRANRTQYPSNIRKMIDDIPLKGMKETPLRNRLKSIDWAIRDLHTDKANQLAGFGKASEKPFIESVRGSSNEGGRFSSTVTDNKLLTLHGQLKSGGIAEFDSVEFVGSCIIETKMNLNWKSPDEIFGQMMHQASFAHDWGFSQVRWEVWDYDGLVIAREAFSKLESVHPNLASRILIVNPEGSH
jgi:hypothetical protein